MHDKLFEAALGIQAPWSVTSVKFDASAKVLTVDIDFKRGSRFGVKGHEGLHPVHDTVVKEYRHLNFFQHECKLRVRTPRVKLPDGSVRLHDPEFSGRLSGFTLLFEALILMLAQQMPFTAVARIVGESVHRVMAVCERYVELALAAADFSQVKALAVDETSRARGHDYITLAADACRAARAVRHRRARRQDDRAPGRRARRPRLSTGADRVGEHRHVARVHQGLRRTPARLAHHV